MYEFSDNLQTIIEKIVKAIEKAVGEDIRSYLANSNTATNNAIPFLRGDYINTNIKYAMENEAVEIKNFKRASWTGMILIIRGEQTTMSICSKNTLERIPKNKNRRSPHYLQTMVYKENSSEVSPVRQMNLTDFDPDINFGFSEEEYDKGFISIMEETLSMNDDYRHWVIVYEANRRDIVDIAAILLDKDFGVVQEISLIELLKPNFSDLTNIESSTEMSRDAHSLVSIKPGLVGKKASEPERKTEILPKSVEESKEA